MVNKELNIDCIMLFYLSVSLQQAQVPLKKLPLALSIFQFINLPLIVCSAKVVNYFNPTG